MIAAVQPKLNEPSLNRTQVLLMRQTALIDAGFDAETKLMANGDFRLIISHESIKLGAPFQRSYNTSIAQWKSIGLRSRRSLVQVQLDVPSFWAISSVVRA